MFDGIAIRYLRHWAEKAERKPLELRGARQVGKTTLVNLFAKDFDSYIYLNLEEKDVAELFAALVLLQVSSLADRSKDW